MRLSRWTYGRPTGRPRAAQHKPASRLAQSDAAAPSDPRDFSCMCCGGIPRDYAWCYRGKPPNPYPKVIHRYFL